MQTLGVYISVPFCKAKCTFCNFASGTFGVERIDAYVERVCGEIRTVGSRTQMLGAELPRVVNSVYLGGGTPSLLSPAQLRRIFEALRDEFEVDPNAEITLECAPGQLAEATLKEALRQRVNRVSFGVQSFVDSETAAVGRLHTAQQCVAEIARMRSAGVEEISVDLIAGLPGQTAASWGISLQAVLDADVPHASVYMLEVDEESRLGKELIAGGPRYQTSNVPSDDAITDFYSGACGLFGSAGLRQYEISNFAHAGHESRHNLKYWQRQPYLGFGLDAHSLLRRGNGAVRFANADDLDVYCAGMDDNVTNVDADAAFEEAWFLGLRMNDGVDVVELTREFGSARVRAAEEMMQNLVKGGTLCRDGDRVMLTNRGRMISNEVFAELLGAAI